MKKPLPHKVWRFQRSTIDGDVVSAMTRDRQQALHFRLDAYWRMNFGERFTFYATAMIVGPLSEPRLRVLQQRDEGDW